MPEAGMDSERNGSEPKLVGYSPLRTLTLFSGQLARHREKKRKSTNPSVSIDLNNVKSLPDIHGMSLIQVRQATANLFLRSFNDAIIPAIIQWSNHSCNHSIIQLFLRSLNDPISPSIIKWSNHSCDHSMIQSLLRSFNDPIILSIIQ